MQLSNDRLTNTLNVVQDAQQRLVDFEQRFNAAGSLQGVSGGMVLIPAGSFVMGACTNVGQEGLDDAVSQHTVHVGAFYLDRYEWR